MEKVSLIAKLQTDPEKAEEVEAALAATCSAAEEGSDLKFIPHIKTQAKKESTGSLKCTQTVTLSVFTVKVMA